MSSLQAVTASAKDWVEALTRLSPAMTGRKAAPILHMVHIDPASGTLSAYNYAVSAVTDIPGAEGEGEPFLVSHQWLLGAIRSTTGSAKKSAVTVSVDGKKVTLSARGYELYGETDDVANYPDIPAVQADVSRTVAAKDFREALRRVASAASQYPALRVLNAVNVEFVDGGLEFTATDRYRLAEDFIPGQGAGGGVALLPLSAVKSMDRFFAGESVEIGLAEEWISIVTEKVSFTVASIDGDYPKIKHLFPTEVTTQFEMDRLALLEAAKVAHAMSERNMPCFIRMFDGGAEVTFADGLFGPSKAPLAGGGVVVGARDEIHFALTPRYFVDALQQITTTKVRVSYVNMVKPFLFTPADVDATCSRIVKHLIMPVRMPR